MKIKKITKTAEVKKVYDITVQCDHNYILENGVVTHNSGAIYAASSIFTLNKSKDKDGTDVVGNIIRVTTYKSRFTKEAQKVELKLDFNTGLDRYHGLLPLAEKYGIFKKVSTRYELVHGPDKGKTVWGKNILEEPEKYYTKEILDLIDEAAGKEYKLGMASIDEEMANIEEEVDTNDA